MTESAAARFARSVPRKTLQRHGQFWTPGWVARAMAAYVLGTGARRVFDPAVGGGAMLLAARAVASERTVELAGCEVEPETLRLAQADGLTSQDMRRIAVQDYLAGTRRPEQAIICNPPYIRHHRLTADVKERLRSELQAWLGVRLDGRLGLHVYFLLVSLRHLAPGGRLAYITSADILEGKSSETMWRAILRRFRLDAVVTFDEHATPFPSVDTNPVITLIAGEPPASRYRYLRVTKPETRQLEDTLKSLPITNNRSRDLVVEDRRPDDYVTFGLARSRMVRPDEAIPLGRLVRCVRGIATGSNGFFFLPESIVTARGLPREFFVRAVGRTGDVPGEVLSEQILANLESSGRPTWLLNLRGHERDALPLPVLQYLKAGESQGLSRRPLIHTRRHWYWVEHREPAPFLFAYLGRRRTRLIRNLAGVQALTGFLYVYPRDPWADARGVDHLWRAMSDTRFLSNLDLVAKTYGGGALKVEPRALERVPVPMDVLAEHGIQMPEEAERPMQFAFEKRG